MAFQILPRTDLWLSGFRDSALIPTLQKFKPYLKMSLPDPKQTAIWKAMDGSEKYSLFAATIRQTRELNRVGIRLRRPDATPEEVEKELARI